MEMHALPVVNLRLRSTTFGYCQHSPPGRLNYRYQTHDQLTQRHRSKNQVIRDLQLTVRVKCIHYTPALTIM
jgi:hypothetical protein